MFSIHRKMASASKITTCLFNRGIVDFFRSPKVVAKYWCRIVNFALYPKEREHINKYILDCPEDFKVKRMLVNGAVYRPELRMAVDTFEDWQRVNKTMTKLLHIKLI